MDCIADTIYYEARGEGEQGMRAIAHVIINRANEKGVNPCIIVNQPKQFAKKSKIKEWGTWNLAKKISQNPGWDFTRGATYFHNLSVKPKWSYKLKVTYKFGSHVFYKPY